MLKNIMWLGEEEEAWSWEGNEGNSEEMVGQERFRVCSTTKWAEPHPQYVNK